ncbi:MAG: outer membrane protein assembly factor BamA [Candidatus Kuenenia sp.]|nr:outer membrane protein assembly factor BamA [Candidatus Kuenenia hertensis]
MKPVKVLLYTAKIIVLLVLALYCANGKVFCDENPDKNTGIIRKVEIRGNQRISTAAIRSSIRSKEGDLYDPNLVSQDVDAIWSLGFFDNIEVEIEETADGLNLIFLVSERAVIDKIQFSGNKKIKSKKLAKEIEIKEGDTLKYHLLKLDEDKIRDLYKKKCFSRVQVLAESKVINGETVVIFNIEEGPRVRIFDIQFKGNTSYKPRKLLKQMETRKKRFPTLIFPGRFAQDVFESDIAKLKEFYMNNGWLDVDVGWEIAYENDNSEMYITIHVKEGERYYVDTLDINGAAIFTGDELKAALKLKEGGPFFLDAVEKDTYQIRLAYGAQGYLATVVNEKHTFAAEEPKVKVVFDIEERDRYYIDKIKIVGNDKTRDNVIRRQLTFNPGERLNVEKIRDSQRRLTNTGYFDVESGMPAGISFEQGSEPNKKNIIVEVKEGRTGMLRFGGGYGANVGAFGDISYTDRNFDIFDFPKSWNDFLSGNAFRGAGEILTLRFSPGFERTEVLLSLTNPSVFDSPYSAGASAFNYIRWYSLYEQKSSGSRISLGRELVRDTYVRVSPSFELIGIERREDEDDAPQDVLDAEGSHLKTGITFSAEINKTDNIFVPTKGYAIDTSVEFACLDVDIVKYDIRAKKYSTLFEIPKWGKHVVAYGGTFGIVESTSGEDVPIFERYYAGGFGSLRGFEYRGVSPLDQKTDEQVGGDLLVLMNTEYLVPLYKDVVRVALFVDAGKADRSISDFSFERFRVSSGLGLRLNVPFLGQSAISIDYGIPIMREEGDETQGFSFNFGGGSSF